MLRIHRDYLRSSLFGVQDALISTGGAMVGIAIASNDKRIVLISGLVIVLVEAIAMASSEFVSDEIVHVIDKKDRDNVFLSALIMFFSYLIAGLIPVLPYILFPLPQSIIISVIFSLLGLAVLGIFKGMISKASLIKNSLEVVVIGGVVTIIGLLVGYILKI
ncbi:MAG: VIT1/CCC1 transporter family protein [Microgenomates group bacterium]|jgi:predicted membrane protein (TIGR00267 family)